MALLLLLRTLVLNVFQCIGGSGLGGVEEALQAHTRKVCGGGRHEDGPHRHHELGGQGAGA